MGHPSINDRCETECTGRKVTRKQDSLQEVAYEMFGPASLQQGGKRQLLVANKVSGQMGAGEHMWLGWMTNDQRTNNIKMI